MLVLSRKAGERIVLGRSIVVEVLQIDASRVRLGIRAPSAVTVLRHELMEGEDGAIDSQTDVHRRVKQPQEDLP